VQPGATEHDEGLAPRNMAPDLVSKAAIDDMMKESSQYRNDTRETKTSEPAAAAIPVEKPPEIVVDADRNEALEGQRAGEAVFKAIFGDDSDDD
jgi:G patch domain-containing protein 1